MTKLLNYLVLSDLHIGARSTTAKEILSHLRIFFDDFTAKSQFCNIDILFLAGDVWDDTVVFGDAVIVEFISFLTPMLGWCARNNVKFRIVEGTPRHDRLQGATVSKIIEALNTGVDFKYIPSLSIEKMEDLGINVLYVPDECRPTAAIVERDVDALLAEHHLDKVDIAIMHGMFKYQMGSIPMNAKVHDEEFYLSRVKNYINIGHVHTASQYSRILAQGSFDRLKHGEEEQKGGYLVKQLSETEWGHFFIENKLAKIYKTVVVKGSAEKALETIEKAIKKLPHGSYVRIQAKEGHEIFQGFETLRRSYPLFIFSKKAVAEDEKKKVEETIRMTDYVSIVLNKNTITEAVFSDVSIQNNLSPEEEIRLYSMLEELHE